MLKKISVITLAATALIGTAAIMGEVSMPQTTLADQMDNKRTISVNGEGEIRVVPDIAYIQFGVKTEGKTAEEASNKNKESFNKIMSEVKKLGVSSKDIQTVGYYTSPMYNWKNEVRSLDGYEVSHTVKVSYRNVEQIGTLVDVVTKEGANIFDSVHYSTEKRKDYELQALDTAMDDAHKKASKLSGKASVKIQGVNKVVELSNDVMSTYSNYDMAMKSESANSTQVSPGEIVIKAQVNVEYGF